MGNKIKISKDLGTYSMLCALMMYTLLSGIWSDGSVFDLAFDSILATFYVAILIIFTYGKINDAVISQELKDLSMTESILESRINEIKIHKKDIELLSSIASHNGKHLDLLLDLVKKNRRLIKKEDLDSYNNELGKISMEIHSDILVNHPDMEHILYEKNDTEES